MLGGGPLADVVATLHARSGPLADVAATLHVGVRCGSFFDATTTLQLAISCMFGPRIMPSRLLNLQGFGFSSRRIYYKLDIDLKVINTNDVVL